MMKTVIALAGILATVGISNAQTKQKSSLGVADLQCLAGFTPVQGTPITFALLTGVQGVGVLGNSISVSGSQFTSIVLQPGVYRISWEWDMGPGWQGLNLGNGLPPSGNLQPTLNGDPQIWTGNPIQVAQQYAERLIAVTSANSVLQFLAEPMGGPIITGGCQLIILQLQ
jgi:hypothetical protein